MSDEAIEGNLLSKLFQQLKKHWFLIGLVLAVILAALYPPLGKKYGILRTEITVSYICVGLIFLISGLGLKTAALKEALMYWKLILLVQGISLVFIPAAAWLLVKLLLSLKFDILLCQGLIIACCCPTTISSNVLMTKTAGGNEAAALTNAVLGSILGVFVSPALIFWILNIQPTSTNIYSIFVNLGATVIAPLIVGQIIRNVWVNFVPWLQKKINLSIVNSALLLCLVYVVFCDTFAAGIFKDISISNLLLISVVCLVLFLLFSAVSFGISRIPIFNFSKQDSIAILMCGATKTVALGIPLINVIFYGDPSVGVLSIPLLIYHAEQLFIGSFYITWLSKWVKPTLNIEIENSAIILIER